LEYITLPCVKGQLLSGIAEGTMSLAESSALQSFAAELRAHRQSSGWTQVQLGERIGYSGSFVSDVERCERSPALDFARACDREFGLPGTFERWHELTNREAYPAFFAPVIPFEREALRIHGWELGAIPGLLQTDDYARSVIKARWPADGEAAIDRTVAGRVERQEILTRERPPLLWYVLHEGVLRHVIGSPTIMAQQLDKLIKAAESPGIILQILPFSASDHAGVEGPIVIYERPGNPPVAYTECYGGGRIVEAQDEVADLTMVMGMLRAAALPVRESASLLLKIRSELDD
jgi:transcriptional regulator with XRE-family HTH domain